MKKPRVPNIVFLAILTAITSIFWIFFSVYRVFSVKPTSSVAPAILEPITPTLDSTAMDKIQSAVFLSEEEISQLPVVTPAPIESPIATEAPSPSPEATESAEITEEL